MIEKNISCNQTGKFSSLMLNYIDNLPDLQPFYHNYPSMEGFKIQLEERQFSDDYRQVLVQSLKNQYDEYQLSDSVQSNIEKLKNNTTYTVTTGHQLNLFTGPLYFIYKIVNTINLAKQLSKEFPEKTFVPIFWMATEDHDYEEVNYFTLFNKKYKLEQNISGAVGRMKLEGIESVFTELEEDLNGRNGLDGLIKCFKKHYLSSQTFTEAIRGVVNEFFGEWGLVIVDGDDASLKRLFIPEFKKELLERRSSNLINATSVELENMGYKKQVNPREINLFYLENELRERIVFENNRYQVLNTDISFFEDEILKELDNCPEKFSPNAVMRPLYQEKILPNLAYIGGGGELAYWFQLKSTFDAHNLLFPVLVLRNSVMLVDKGSLNKIKKLELSTSQLFEETGALIKDYLKNTSDIELDLSNESKQLENLFHEIDKKAGEIDVTLQPMVQAELQKGLKAIKNIEGRLLKAEKQKSEVVVKQIESIKSKLFPNNSLQERSENIIYGYLIFGDKFIGRLINELSPLTNDFTILTAE